MKVCFSSTKIQKALDFSLDLQDATKALHDLADWLVTQVDHDSTGRSENKIRSDCQIRFAKSKVRKGRGLQHVQPSGKEAVLGCDPRRLGSKPSGAVDALNNGGSLWE